MNLPENLLNSFEVYDFKTNKKLSNLNDIENLNSELRISKDSIYLIKGGNIIPWQSDIK